MRTTTTSHRKPLFKTVDNLFSRYQYGDKSEDTRKSLLTATEALLAASSPDTPLSPDEANLVADVIGTIENDKARGQRRSDPGQPNGEPKASPVAAKPSGNWINQHTGKPVLCLQKGDRYANHVQPVGGINAGELSLGRAIIAMVRGSWANAPAEREFYNALGTGLPGGGATMVPHQLAANIIDMARAKTALVNAGAITVPMETDRMTMARVSNDPVLETKAENAAFTGTDMVFGELGFTARTIGNVVTMSRELADDALNASQAVENALASALAVHLDRLGLVGDGGGDGIIGLATYDGIGATGSVGGITWEDLQTAVVDIQTHNGQPNAYIASPTIAGDLAALTSGDGTNSAKLWLGPPPNVAPLSQFITSSCPDDKIFVGDFTQFVFALRSGVELQVSTEAGDAFDKYQVKIRIVWRGDTGLLQPSHFHLLYGITT